MSASSGSAATSVIGDGKSANPDLSADGGAVTSVIYHSSATNFDFDSPDNGVADVFQTRPVPPVLFTRGDVDGNGSLNITDAIRITDYLFQGGPPPPCFDAADVDDDGALTITDAIALSNGLFQGFVTLPCPSGINPCACRCEPDHTPDALDCAIPPEPDKC